MWSMLDIVAELALLDVATATLAVYSASSVFGTLNLCLS
jgi:hypothetical protein